MDKRRRHRLDVIVSSLEASLFETLAKLAVVLVSPMAVLGHGGGGSMVVVVLDYVEQKLY